MDSRPENASDVASALAPFVFEGELRPWWTVDSSPRVWRERFLTLMEAADNPILMIGPSGRVSAFNRSAVRHLAGDSGSLLGKTAHQLFVEVPDDLPLTALEEKVKGLETWSRAGSPLSDRIPSKRFRWSSARLHDDGNVPAGLLLYAEDITHEFEIEDKLERALRELEDEKAAIDAAAIVAITDAKGKITYANKKFCEISKFTPEELLGQNHRIINSGFHPRSFFVELWKTIASGRVWKGEIKNRAKDGTYYWVDTTIVPFLDKGRKPYRYVSIRFDITEKKRAGELLDEERARTVYASKLASLGEMAAGIAHELGTPLATIRGRMEMLQYHLEKGGVDEARVMAVAKTVVEQSDRMARIIRAVLGSARDGSTDPIVKIELAPFASDILEYSTERFRKNGITVSCAIEPGLTVEARETEISQVLINLLANACDAVASLGERWVRLEGKRTDRHVELRIIDSGSGIPPEVATKMMDPFFTTKGVGKGTGLGLSISRKLLERYDASLTLDSGAANTTFVIRFPVPATA